MDVLQSEYFWLPPGVSWSLLHRGDAEWFLPTLPYAVALTLLLRYEFECFVAEPLGMLSTWGTEIKKLKAPKRNHVLQTAYENNNYPHDQKIKRLSIDTSWSVNRVSKWFWRARNQNKPSKLTKFKESFWRCTAYSALTVFGLAVYTQEPYFYDQRIFFKGYPYTVPSSNISRYWFLQVIFYSSLLISQFQDIKRKDFYPMMVHHLATSSLLMAMYVVNALPVALILTLLHDISDIPLELAKLLHYKQLQKMANVMFVIFMLTFFVTRLVIYPLWVLRAMLVYTPEYIGIFPALVLLAALCLTLMVLQIYWFRLIVLVVINKIKKGEEKDIRSDSEGSDYDDDKTA